LTTAFVMSLIFLVFMFLNVWAGDRNLFAWGEKDFLPLGNFLSGVGVIIGIAPGGDYYELQS